MRRLTVIVVILSLGMGCASLTNYEGSTPALAALADALQEEATQENHIIRWNPVNCDCPEWELRLRDRWVRTEVLTDDEELTQELVKVQNQVKVEVGGTLSPSPYRCGPSLLCSSLRVSGILSRGVEPLP